MTANKSARRWWMAAVILVVVAAIGRLAAGQGKAATPPAVPSPPEVGVIRVQGEAVSTYREYPARTYARDLVEVRGRVDGYVDRRLFEIGSDVRAGQVLYRLDVRPYEAEVARAQGALAQAAADIAQAEATLLKARQDVNRLEPLAIREAVAEAGPRQRARRAPGRRCGSQRPQGVGRGEPRHPADRGAEPRIRDDPRADQRPHRRQPAAGRRAGHENLAAAADDDRAARPDLGALPDQRGGAAAVPRRRRLARCRFSWC